MITIEDSIKIEAEPRIVYELILRRKHLSKDWPVLKLENIDEENFTWEYSLLMLKFSGTSKIKSSDAENLVIVVKNKGSFNSTVRWECKPHESGTELHFRVDYYPPLMVQAATLLNKGWVKVLLNNIKTRMEKK